MNEKRGFGDFKTFLFRLDMFISSYLSVTNTLQIVTTLLHFNTLHPVKLTLNRVNHQKESANCGN